MNDRYGTAIRMGIAFLVVMRILSLSAYADDGKLTIPSDAALKQKVVLVAEVYKPDYEAAKKAADRIELAKKMISDGDATTDDPVGKFVLYRIARNIAARQGDLATALEAIERIDEKYEIEKGEMQLEAATTAVKDLKKSEEFRRAGLLLEPFIDAAINANQFDQAKALAQLTSKCAKQGRDSDTASRVETKLLEIQEIATAFDKVKPSEQFLIANPTDPESNLAVGKFLCLFKGDWKKGYPMLALGSDQKLKSAALLELEPVPDAAKLGDTWWRISENLSGLAQRRAQFHAGEWYQQALPSLSGLSKRIAEIRLAKSGAYLKGKIGSGHESDSLLTKANKSKLAKSALNEIPPAKISKNLTIDTYSNWQIVKGHDLGNFKNSPKFSLDNAGRRAAIFGVEQLQIINLETGSTSFQAPPAHYTSAAFALDDQLLCCSTTDFHLKGFGLTRRREIFDVDFGQARKKGVRSRIESSCTWSADRTKIAYITSNHIREHIGEGRLQIKEFRNQVEVMDVKTGKVIRSIKKGLPGCRSATISADKSWVAAGSPDAAFIWDIRTGKTICELGPEAGVSRKLWLSHDKRYCFSATGRYTDRSGKNLVAVYELPLGKKLCEFTTSAVVAIQATTDGRFLMVAGTGSLSFRNLETGVVISNLKAPSGRFTDAAIYSDDRIVTLSTKANRISPLKLTYRTELKTWKKSDDVVP